MELTAVKDTPARLKTNQIIKGSQILLLLYKELTLNPGIGFQVSHAQLELVAWKGDTVVQM